MRGSSWINFEQREVALEMYPGALVWAQLFSQAGSPILYSIQTLLHKGSIYTSASPDGLE